MSKSNSTIYSLIECTESIYNSDTSLGDFKISNPKQKNMHKSDTNNCSDIQTLLPFLSALDMIQDSKTPILVHTISSFYFLNQAFRALL